MIDVPHRAPIIQPFHGKSNSVVKKTEDLIYPAVGISGIKKIGELLLEEMSQRYRYGLSRKDN